MPDRIVYNSLNPLHTLDNAGRSDKTLNDTYVNVTGDTMTGDLKGISFYIGANTLTTSEFAFLDGQDQAVKQASNVTFGTITSGIINNDSDKRYSYLMGV
jgi:hypothetical protein